MGILTNSTYDTRIEAGIDDKNIAVAHKIGTYGSESSSDCGIVYYPKRHYVICIMLKAPESLVTDKHIENISRLVYDYVSKL